MTGGRDSVCRVWDMRSKVQAHVLTGHDDTVCSILSQGSDPQVRFVLLCEFHLFWVIWVLFFLAFIFRHDRKRMVVLHTWPTACMLIEL